jgi:UDP-N-acetylglucosamine 2-epimerase (non-hydrolysing)/GDP/UDP-N,N'-diacetylbacillosamine 2-epimerase (hydrolysing)
MMARPVESLKMRRVLYLSGSRADYGPARRVLRAIQASDDLELGVLVTGMHLDPVHGETWEEIAADGLLIAERVGGRVPGDSLAAMSASIGLYLHEMSFALERLRPDVLLVLGDRGEQLAGAMAAAFQNIVVVHLCGGSLSGSIDDSVRHAITKFAHYHLPAFEEHARRIIQMGETPSRVRAVGLPGGDIRPDVTLTRAEVCLAYGLPTDEPYLLVVQHAVTQSQGAAEAQIVETLEAVVASGYHALLANPNDDAGGRAILSQMKDYASKHARLHIFAPPRNRERYASVMAHAGAQVGNSSSGIVEAMSVSLPVVNIGERQRGREHLSCMLNVPYDRRQIAQAILTALHDEEYRQRLRDFSERMGQQDTASLVLECLRGLDLQAATRPKPFYDLPNVESASASSAEPQP